MNPVVGGGGEISQSSCIVLETVIPTTFCDSSNVPRKIAIY